MKPLLRRRLWVLVLLLAGLVAGLCGCAEKSRRSIDRVPVAYTILFFNDPHGHLLPFAATVAGVKQEVGGIARLAARVEEIRADNRRRGRKTFLFVAGDILQGTPLSTVYHGRPDVQCFNAMGVDALTVGNHEFDFGMENFNRLRQLADFPFLSANIRVKASGDLLCAPLARFALADDVELTVVGVTTRELLSTTRPANVEGLSLDDSLAAVRTIVENREKKGPVVVLSHSRHATDRQIAASLPEIDAIIGGHDHLLFVPYRRVNGVPIFEALDNGRYLGRIDLVTDPVSGETVMEASRYLPITSDLPQDPAVARIVAGYQDRLGGRFDAVIGRCEVQLDGRRASVRYEETALGDFVADIMREYTGADIALVNAGALRAGIDPGPVTLGDVFRALPFENEIIRVQVSGKDILAALERSVRGTREDEDGGFLQVSGIRFAVQGHRVADVGIGNPPRALDPEATYSAALPDFLATGGDGYTLFVGKPALNTRLSLRDVVVDAIRSQGTVNTLHGNRIVRTEN